MLLREAAYVQEHCEVAGCWVTVKPTAKIMALADLRTDHNCCCKHITELDTARDEWEVRTVLSACTAHVVHSCQNSREAEKKKSFRRFGTPQLNNQRSFLHLTTQFTWTYSRYN